MYVGTMINIFLDIDVLLQFFKKSSAFLSHHLLKTDSFAGEDPLALIINLIMF